MTYKKGDTIPLQYVIEEWNVDTQGTEVHNLSGETVTFSMYCMDADFSIEDKPCSVVVASEGLIEYEWATGETDIDGMYRCLFKVTSSDGKVSTFPEYDTQWLWIVDDSRV